MACYAMFLGALALAGPLSASADDAAALLQVDVYEHASAEAQAQHYAELVMNMAQATADIAKRSHYAKLVKGCSVDDEQTVQTFRKKLEPVVKEVATQIQEKIIPVIVEAQKKNSTPKPEDFPKIDVPKPDLAIDTAACDPKSMISGMSVNWKAIEGCAKGFGFTQDCAKCPTTFMKAAFGGDMLSLPFSCLPKCAGPLTACKPGADGKLGNKCVKSSLPCLKCFKPKMVNLESCMMSEATNQTMRVNVGYNLDTMIDMITNGNFETEEGMKEVGTKFQQVLPSMLPKAVRDMIPKEYLTPKV